MPYTYLVTGGNGFIGRNVVKGLAARGYQVISFDNNWRSELSHQVHQTKSAMPTSSLLDSIRASSSEARDSVQALSGEQVQYITGDIRDAEAVDLAMQGVDGVCHLAYINGTEFFYSHPEMVLDVGVKGMINVLDACRNHGVKDLVLASSSEVYQTPPMVPTIEEVPMIVPDAHNPRYSYGGGKIISELMAINYGRTYFDKVRIVRPHNIYGPDMGWEHVVPQFIMRLKELSAQSTGVIPFPIQGTGEETRAFCYISDMVDAWIRVTESGEHLGVYNAGTSEEVTITYLANAIACAMGIEIEIVPGDLQPGGTPRRCPEISKVSSLGYRPQISLSQGLSETVKWYLANQPPIGDTASQKPKVSIETGSKGDSYEASCGNSRQ